MFFEGSEKKIEIVIKPDLVNLRSLGHSFWRKIVKACKAEVLSFVENEEITAYLLSESSLFVWNDKIVMITCGQTVLANSAIKFIQEFGMDKIRSLIFQRKNEYDSRLQSTSFKEDIQGLTPLVSGRAYRLGDLDAHHNFIFHTENSFVPERGDVTSEMLMYHLTGSAAEVLQTAGQKKETIQELIGVHKLFDGFLIDDFMFAPYGYSLNAIKDDYYATIHITPQEHSSYVSFETNLDEAVAYELMKSVVKVFAPRSFDMVTFNFQEKPHLEFAGHIEIARVNDRINNYDVDFTHFVCPDCETRKATVIF